MRRYSIAIRNPTTGQLFQFPSLSGTGMSAPIGTGSAQNSQAYPWQDATIASSVNGQNISGALNIEMDMTVTNSADPAGACWLRIWGISLPELATIQNLAGYDILVSGGMSAGLPLANPKQYGPLFGGVINQAFGNWEGLQQTADFYLVNQTGGIYKPAKIVLNWPKGTPLSSAIKSCLSAAFPDHFVKVGISPNYVQSYDDGGYWTDINAFAKWIKEKTLSIIPAAANGGFGVEMYYSPDGNQIVVYDATNPGDPTITKSSPTNPKKIAFSDMIGQPLVINAGTISFKMTLRADIQASDYIYLQPNVAQVQDTAKLGFQGQPVLANQINNNFAVAGLYRVNFLRYMGNFRQADAGSWVTVFQASIVSNNSGQSAGTK